MVGIIMRAAIPLALLGVSATPTFAQSTVTEDAEKAAPQSVIITETATGRARDALISNPIQAKQLARRAALVLVVEKACQEVEGANHGRVVEIYDEKYEDGAYTIIADVQVWKD